MAKMQKGDWKVPQVWHQLKKHLLSRQYCCGGNHMWIQCSCGKQWTRW